MLASMDKEKTRRAIDQVFRDMAGAMSAGMALVGTRTGLFRAMAGKGPMTVDEVVRASQLQRRYVEEWLRGMASAGYLEYSPAAQTYELPEEMAYFVASDGSDHFVGGMWEMVPPLMRVAPQVAGAFAKGGGVRFEEFGPDCLNALDLINRGQYEQRFTDYWLKALPDTMERLRAGGRVLDYGCGSGRVAIAIKKAFPAAELAGYDVDAQSIARAREAAKELQIAFGSEKPSGQFDLITICDCIHDLAAPVETLREIHRLLKADGTLFIVEPKAADRLEDNRNPVATMFYGFSLFHCMTQSLARGGPGLGTCMGPQKTEGLLRDAGFRDFRQLDIKSMTNLFYAAKP
ncbi:MAG: methyltransferase domain-containing protein [Betaproteobacteria bacterium]|nr:MAG: methyltransferase domain-containing protein [Betaproteobacteria bacterium]